MNDRHDAADVARMLGKQIQRLALQLLSAAPRRDGDIWRWGSLSGEEGQSLCVWVAGPKRGRWFEFNGQTGGDALDLVAKTRCGDDLGQALSWARDWLGLGQLSSEERERQAERARAASVTREVEEAHRREHRAADAKAMWLAAAPLQPGDLVWRYLAGRGIDLDALPRRPGAIRCHPGLYHKAGSRWPAMVAAISGRDANGDVAHVATQRTWLTESNGEVKKAPLGHDAKMSLGPFRHCGGAIHLTRGARGKPWNETAADESIGFAEGIEDALTFATIHPETRTAACAASLAYLARVALPPSFAEGRGRVVVIAQNDPMGSDALRAQAKGIAGLRARGVTVSVLRPPVFVKDVNDWAQWLRRGVPEEVG